MNLDASADALHQCPNAEDIKLAAQRLAGRTVNTPVLTSAELNKEAGCELFFKCENLQRTGSFKARGATHAALVHGKVPRLITHSSGNHGAALAYAGKELGVPVTVVIPNTAPRTKRDNIAQYGAELITCGPTIADREQALAKVAASGGVVVPPYNDPLVISGQGTLATELVEAVPDLEAFWVPVGGGGMASGCVTAVGHKLQVYGAEPELARDAHDSLQRGECLGPMPPRTLADGLRGALGDLTFAILADYKLPITLVSEAMIEAAQKRLMHCLKVLVEPSGAVAFAAVLARQQGPNPMPVETKVGVLISGGNFDFQLA